MKLFGLEIKKVIQPEPQVLPVTCYGCARTFAISASEQRVYNYCNSCK